MSERVKRVPPQVETPMPATSFLRSAFTHPKFSKSVIAVANHTVRRGAEAGFIVQQKGAQAHVSKVLKSPPMGSIENSEVSESIAIEKLCTSYQERNGQTIFRYKQGIVLTLHSHPGDPYRNSLSYLRPSEDDIDIWAENRDLFRSPHLLEGILVINERNARLFLFQADPMLELTNDYQAWDAEKESLPELYRLMSQSGIRYELMNFDLREKAFTDADLEKLKTFSAE